ncbi:MAG: hypothetical protein CL471_12325 [Acidobacteria bacterium]|nr:hypothetical protein [Acidobacteriota bacterium]
MTETFHPLPRQTAGSRGEVVVSKARRSAVGAAISPLLYRVPDAAVLLGVSEREVWGMLRRGELPKVTIPGRRMTRIARADLEAVVATWRTGAGEFQPERAER